MKANMTSKEVLVISILCRLAIVQCGAAPLSKTGIVSLIHSPVWKVSSMENKFELLKEQVEKEYKKAEGDQKKLLGKARELYV